MSNNRKILLGADNNALTWLIVINGVVFITLKFLEIVYYLSDIPKDFYFQQIFNWFILPGNTEKLFTRPWTLVTYMFTHDGIFSLISNMLWLWLFGYILQDLTGNRKLIPLYMYGGVVGGIVYVLVANIFPVFSQIALTGIMVGAGASVMSVAVATTTLAPDYRIFQMINGGIPLWVLTLIFVAIDFAFVASSNGAVSLAHLSGALMGFIFIKQLQKGNDWGEWMTSLLYWFDNLFSPEKKVNDNKQKERIYYQSSGKPFTKKPNITQQRVDELLDKINQKGYHFLTDEEKAFLEKASNQDL
jgi:membrane associated rhomboid family serine protease